MERNSSQTENAARKLRVGILGCTGAVGQRFIELLETHPYFVVFGLGASSRSAGKRYKDVVSWKQATPIPAAVRDIVVTECVPSAFVGCDLVFSGLDSSVAGEVEDAFAAADFPVFSNSKNHRMDPDVPIVIPEVNADHMRIVPHQRRLRGYRRGFIVTNANCSTTGLVIALKPIVEAFGIEKMAVFTMQAVSGAGYPGVSSMDIIDNVVPYISGEEEKMEEEPRKIFGTLRSDDSEIQFAEVSISAHCNRVPVLDGHTECVSLQLRKPATVDEVAAAIRDYKPRWTSTHLPSAPAEPIVLTEAVDRPQPRLDRNRDRGYSVTVGRVRKCNLFDVKLALLSHNTIVGAAGGSILNAELAVLHGYV